MAKSKFFMVEKDHMGRTGNQKHDTASQEDHKGKIENQKYDSFPAVEMSLPIAQKQRSSLYNMV